MKLNIFVNATALDARGSYSLIKTFLIELNEEENYLKKMGIKLTILVAKKELCSFSTENIKINYEPYPKKSLLHKFLFENSLLPKILKGSKVDAYLSLQNIGLSRIEIPQFTLVHQGLLLENLKLNELEYKNNIKYKLIMKWTLKWQVKKITGIIVQTKWMMQAIKKDFNYKGNIKVIRPKTKDITSNIDSLEEEVTNKFKTNSIKLFYPTNEEKYKNNTRLINAIRKYNEENERKVTLYLTTEGEDEKYIKYLSKVPYGGIYNIYKMSDALIFPSLVESLGLPILEAKQSNIDLILADLPYGREVGGESAVFFNPRDITDIVEKIKEYINKIDNNEKNNPCELDAQEDSYIDYTKFIYESLRDKKNSK